MKKKNNPYEKPELRVAAIAIAIFLVILSAFLPFNRLSFTTESGNSPLNVLTRLALISLFIERGTEVFVELWRGSKKDYKKHIIRLIKQRLKQPTNDINEHEELQKELHKQSEDLHKYQAITKRVALWTGFLFGLLMSLAGVRALSLLFKIENIQNHQHQLSLFQSLDVLLTAALISGGSEAIHQILTVYKRFMEESERKITPREQDDKQLN